MHYDFSVNLWPSGVVWVRVTVGKVIFCHQVLN